MMFQQISGHEITICMITKQKKQSKYCNTKTHLRIKLCKKTIIYNIWFSYWSQNITNIKSLMHNVTLVLKSNIGT